MLEYKYSLNTAKAKAGDEINPVNAPADAPTIYADFVTSVTVNPNVIKLSLSEQIGDNSGNTALKYILNLALGRQTLRDIHNLIGQIITTIERDEEGPSQ